MGDNRRDAHQTDKPRIDKADGKFIYSGEWGYALRSGKARKGGSGHGGRRREASVIT